VIHPIVHPYFMCVEHAAGQLTALGDALGADCAVADLKGGRSGRFPVFFHGDGSRNQDWYGWREPLLAPFNAVIDSVLPPPLPNRPGNLGRERGGVIIFRRADSVRVLYAHVQDIRVRPGDEVRAGKPVARVGNNGLAYFPHTHVGAWRGTEPLQIRFDLRAMGRMSRQSQTTHLP
jgi:murein DD-endopeptidase MepM/ murein hydrolase activator NlpD